MKCIAFVTILVAYSRPPRGGRGLKLLGLVEDHQGGVSPPSRGAWIEMSLGMRAALAMAVAPLAGGVD